MLIRLLVVDTKDTVGTVDIGSLDRISKQDQSKHTTTKMPYIITPAQMLRRGLRMINIDNVKQGRRLEKTNIYDFKSNFGKNPIHLCRVWRDLQTTTVADAHMTEEEARSNNGLKGFLMANNFLKTYNTLSTQAALFQGADKTLTQRMIWRFVPRIAHLRADKIVWPTWTETFIATVDGTCTRNQEPRDPNLRCNRKNFCKKFQMAGRNHEIAIDLWSSRVVHVSISEQGSVHDLTIYRKELAGKVLPGKRLIADKGYTCFKNDEHLIISFPNPLDDPALRRFKADARARHENFNKRLKDYDCLDDTFYHELIEKQQLCFYAVVVLCQYAIEDTGPYGEPLNRL